MSTVTVIQPENYTSDEPLQLAEIVKSSPLEKSQGQKYLALFTPFFNKMAEIEKKIGLLNTVNPAKEDINIARQIRLALKDNRVEAEKTKDKEKASVLIEGRLIDSLFGVVNNSSKSLELKCQEIEKAAEIAETKRKQELAQERVNLLSPYEIDLTGFDLGNMTVGTFDQLLENTKAGYEKRIEDKRKEEELKVQREANERLHGERKKVLYPIFQWLPHVVQNNNELHIYSIDEFDSIVNKAKSDKASHDLEQKRIAEENAALKHQQDLQIKRFNALKPYLQYCEGLNMTALYVFADKEFEDILFDKQASYNKDKQEKEAAELQRQKDIAGRKASAEQVLVSLGFEKVDKGWANPALNMYIADTPNFETHLELNEWVAHIEKHHYAEQQRLAALAPDKEKLLKLADEFSNYVLPMVTSDEANKTLFQTKALLYKISTYIKQQIEKL